MSIFNDLISSYSEQRAKRKGAEDAFVNRQIGNTGFTATGSPVALNPNASGGVASQSAAPTSAPPASLSREASTKDNSFAPETIKDVKPAGEDEKPQPKPVTPKPFVGANDTDNINEVGALRTPDKLDDMEKQQLRAAINTPEGGAQMQKDVNGVNPTTGKTYTNEEVMNQGIQGLEKKNAIGGDFRQYLIDKDSEKAKKKERTRQMVLALGDMVRHAFNLAGTTQGANSQQLNSAYMDDYNRRTAQEEKDKAAALAREKVLYEREAANRKADREDKKLESTMALNEARRNQIAQKIGIDASKLPYEINELIEKAGKAKSDAEKAGYEAQIKKATAAVADELNKAKLNNEKLRGENIKSSIARNYSSISVNNERKRLIGQQIRNNEDPEFPTNDPDTNYKIPKSQVKVIAQQMKGVAKKKSWAKALVDPSTGEVKKSVTDADLLTAAWEHYDDADIQSVFDRYGTTVSSKTSKNNKGTTTYK